MSSLGRPPPQLLSANGVHLELAQCETHGPLWWRPCVTRLALPLRWRMPDSASLALISLGTQAALPDAMRQLRPRLSLQQLLSRHVVPWAGAGAALALPEAVCSKTLARGGCDGLARLGRWPWPLK